MIHGQKKRAGRFAFLSEFVDWTKGCIALKNEEMDVLWEQIAEGTKIEILP
jgi:murein L,D-transpeptidase YafK